MSKHDRMAGIGALILIMGYAFWGLGWGLPSQARAQLFLNPTLRTPEFYAQVEKARDDLYLKMGGNPVAYIGRLARAGMPNTMPTLLNSYSSFLLKPHETDESATIVAVSRLNPKKNRWYPEQFVYGGAFIFPLAAFLGALHVMGFIHLVPTASFYFMHPEEMARLYMAARTWSILGFLFAVIAVYKLARRFSGPRPALWAMVFFALSPTCLAHVKLAKPHFWAAAWSLWALSYCVKAKESLQDRRSLILAALCWGFALGTTQTQIVIAPFLMWVCWTPDARLTLRRMFLVFGIAGLVFCASNFYLPFHWHDYLNEQYFLRQYSPLRFRLGAVWDFLGHALRISLGWELWSLCVLGMGWALWQSQKPRLKQMAAITLFALAYISFQVQAQEGIPNLTRLFLVYVGCVCVTGSLATFAWGNAGKALRCLCLAALVIKGTVYTLHLNSDVAPRDNASQAALWIKENVPEQSVILDFHVVPHVDFFPPIDFTKYRIGYFRDRRPSTPDPVYAVIAGGQREARQELLADHFVLLRRFARSPLQTWGYEDPFINANFTVEVYRKEAAP